ncbi:hypothetical protein B0H19DRAFT_1115032 [Mycena capillaripes]|nr:hypothetical protein B0H19DRAFT_1115032 [Mycena capillaripes]
MATAVNLLRGCYAYAPQIVLGGLTRAVGPVILRYAADAVTKHASMPSFDEPPGSQSSTSPTLSSNIQSTMSPPVSFHLPFSVTQAICPLKHEVPLPSSTCVLFLPIQSMCRLEHEVSLSLSTHYVVLPIQSISAPEPIQTQIVASVSASHILTSVQTNSSNPVSVPTSSDLPHSVTMPQIIGSYLLSPPVVFQLAGLSILFILVMNMHRWRSEPITTNNSGEVPRRSPLQSTRIRKLQRKPSDSSNWRIPRNNTLRTEATQTAVPPQHRSMTSPTIAHPTVDIPGVAAYCEATKRTTPSELPPVPTYATYVPPHKRASFDLGTRRPLANVGNGRYKGEDRGHSLWQADNLDQRDRKHRRRPSSQLPQAPAQRSEPPSRTLRHRSSCPVELTKDSFTRQHSRANTNDGSA